jgi:hypothetical protein
MRCHYCGQALPEKRLGVHMTAFKARLFDLILRAGIDGIPSDDLFSLLYPGGGASRQTLKAHVWQINEMIADEGYRIDGRGSSYRLVNMRTRQVNSRSTRATVLDAWANQRLGKPVRSSSELVGHGRRKSFSTRCTESGTEVR